MMRIGIDVNGVLRDTIGKFDQLYEKNLIDKDLEDSIGQTFELDMSGNTTLINEDLVNFEPYSVKYPDRSATFTTDSPLLIQFDGIGMMELQEQEQR
jgi:hypothetical protein